MVRDRWLGRRRDSWVIMREAGLLLLLSAACEGKQEGKQAHRREAGIRLEDTGTGKGAIERRSRPRQFCCICASAVGLQVGGSRLLARSRLLALTI